MDQIDAIFTANDRMAIGLMQGLVEYGFHAGKDYGIIGYDDSDIATMTIPKLSSVKVPLFDLGQIAAEKVLEMLEKPPTEQLRVRLPVTIMERESVRTILK
ncbi:substrate-binding domain-containing protein [Halalkalibacter akibai]|uniref:Ribose operon repressor n=1 Tax=Halalkalibacter akibai (strain ATCC 43226 / DSM 21942 / CIP 109018 / JCM 9157 / 1139) TaxID=1236973 RepID=W4QWU0_HALA3|nr:substrate-binding domain-containing protein [Halalkalibacter akibai]GAE36372.1 ribose operon repressor [Halalkalibacter akibai JCM 9157]